MTSVVYFLRAEISGLIKIGWTSDLRRRLANLQASSPEQLTLLASCSGGKKLEQHLHARFAKHRAHNEWFRSSQEIADLIGRVAEAGNSIFPASMCEAPPSFRDRSSEAVARASTLLKQIAEPAPRGDSVAAAIARAAARVSEVAGISVSLSRVEDIWRREARQINSDEMDAIAAAHAARPPSFSDLIREGEALAEKLEAMIAAERSARSTRNAEPRV